MGRKNRKKPPLSAAAPGSDQPAAPSPAPSDDPQPPPAPPPAAFGRNALIALAIFLAAAAIRFFRIGSKGLWFDEIHTLTNNVYPQPEDFPHHLFYVIDHFFERFSSDPSVGVRIYPALAGALAVPLLYLFVARLHSPLAGLFAAAALLLQPFHLFHSQEGRFYAPMVLFALAPLWASLEFATETRRRRFAWLAPILLSHYLAWTNHPAAQPFVLAHIGLFYFGLLATDWGAEAALQAAPPLRDRRNARIALGGLGAVGALMAILALLFVKRIKSQARQLLNGGWGETPNVDFTWPFFSLHFHDLGWDARRFPLLGGALGWIAIFAAALGLAALLRKRPYWGTVLVGVAAASFLAIFKFKTGTYYQTKYAAFLLPIFIALLGVGMAEAAGQIARIARPIRGAPHRASALAAAIFGLILVGQLPAAIRYYVGSKMPLGEQFAWLNKNEPGAARVYIYGHAGYPAALYKQELAARHEIKYQPWMKTSGRIEVEEMLGSAASGRPTYFAHCWPWDVPTFQIEWLRKNAAEVARFPSVEAAERDGVLYKIPPPAADEHRSADRPATALDGFGMLGRPGIRSKDGTAPALFFTTAAEARYDIPLKGGQAYRIEVEAESGFAGQHIVTVGAEREPPIVLGSPLAAGEVRVWSGNLTPARDTAHLTLSYVSDGGMKRPEAQRFFVVRIAARPAAPSDAPHVGWIKLPPLRALPQTGEFKILKADGKAPAAASDRVPVTPGGLVHFRARACMHEAFGYGATIYLDFFHANGSPAGTRQAIGTPMGCDVDWDPWTAKLASDPWHLHETVAPVPPGAAFCAARLAAWPSSREKQYPEAANEVRWRDIEFASGPSPFPAPAALPTSRPR